MKARFIFIWLFTAGALLMAPLAANAQYSSETQNQPPIGQVLVREGDYAIRLASTLGVVSTDNEVVAEDNLATLGIAPTSGWISDFPVTPDIIAELQTTVENAAEAGRLLPTGKEDAVRAFVSLNTELGLTVTPAASYQGGYAEGQSGYVGSDQAYSDESAPAYSDTAVLDSYYEEGPPVITYYAPPPDYAYLYAWDPFPFYWGGIFFPGFFILTDFDCHFGFGFQGRFFDRDEFAFYRHHDFDHDRAFISNHVFDRDHRNGFRVDPVTRRPFERTSFRPAGARNFDPVRRSGSHGGRAAFNRAGATRLLGSLEHNNSGGFGRVREGAARNGEGQVRRSWSGSTAPSRTGGSSGATHGFNRGFGEMRGFQRPSVTAGRPSGGSFGGAVSTRSFGRPSGAKSFGGGRQSVRSFSSPSFNGGRSSGRSFSAPPMGGGRSFGGERSFGSSFGGGHSGGFGGGGRSFGGGGRSFGGGGHFGGGRR